jgi:hypothetical protein
VERRRNEGLWNNDDEEYYDEGGSDCAGSRSSTYSAGLLCQGLGLGWGLNIHRRPRGEPETLALPCKL